MATPNPMGKNYSTETPSISKETFIIAGILINVFGLTELPSESTNVACLWLLHPRLQTQACMEPIACRAVAEWNQRRAWRKDRTQALGLIAVTFDQRNHGSREIERLANEAWISGNERHAQDMFSSYRLFPFYPTDMPYLIPPQMAQPATLLN